MRRALHVLTMTGALGFFATMLGCGRPGAPAAPEAAPSPGEPAASAQPAAAASATPIVSDGGGRVAAVPVDALCVTSGAAEPRGMTRFAVTAPTFRAVWSSPSESRAELAFTYVGPSSATRALGSGAVRQQLGLKLRAEDPCNLLYVMWRFEPDAKVVVSVKRNAGARTSAECGNRGYTNVKPLLSAPVPAMTPGSSHVLSASLEGSKLRVLADGVLVWEGNLGADALSIDGPIGVRTDNVHIEAELSGRATGTRAPCSASGEAE